jgi:hypothetical protein
MPVEDQEQTRDTLKAAALKMKYVLTILGIMPVFLVVLEIILAFAIKPESLESIRSTSSRMAILAVLALVAISSVTIEPWFIYRVMIKGQNGSSANPAAIIIIIPSIAITASALGLFVFFLFNIWVSLVFHAMSLIYIWHFNLRIDSFLDRMAKDLGTA